MLYDIVRNWVEALGKSQKPEQMVSVAVFNQWLLSLVLMICTVAHKICLASEYGCFG